MNKDNFKTAIHELTKHHRNACNAYDDICNGVSGLWTAEDEGPFLPVSVFKDLDLMSVPEDQIRRKLTSSGTTGQRVSKIYLDAETSANQQRALCEIVSEYIGEKRIPMLIIDSPDVLRDRTKYSARGAGIMGFSMMASKRFYALDNNMELDLDSIRAFAEAADGGPCFAFGFTFMIWQYFYGGLMKLDEDQRPCLPNCYLIHGGGWKKLADQAVSNEAFKEGLQQSCGITKVSDYYGMAEQTGSIFMECECGHLHASSYSDIVCIDPMDFSEKPFGEEGLLALSSTLPKSYPGHRLLTEDWGVVLGEDDCPCGRPGKYFKIQGRIKKAEIRGCSDTFSGMQTASAATSPSGETDSRSGSVRRLAGSYPVAVKTRPNFDPQIIRFLNELSQIFMKEPRFRQVPEIYALGFWCRKAHLQRLQSRQQESWADASPQMDWGRGLVLHIAPSNMPTMFAYSWITSLLAGNSNVVRLSERESDISNLILEGIESLLSREEFQEIKTCNGFVTFPHGDRTLEELSMQASGRVVWGGDETVQTICQIPARKGCVDVTFPDKYSIAVFDAKAMAAMSDEDMKLQAHLFYNDTYGADQNACSSPRTVFWIDPEGQAEIRTKWWDAVAREAENYDLQPWMATEKYRILCCDYGENKGLKPAISKDNRLYVIPCEQVQPPLWNLEAKMGMFFEHVVASAEEIKPLLDGKIQTAVTNMDGLDLDVDRIVAVGEALDFDTIWDRKDIIRLLSESDR